MTTGTPSRIAVFDVLGTVLDERRGFQDAAASAGAPPGSPAAAPGFAGRWLDAVDAEVSQVASGAAPWRPWEQIIGEAACALDPHANAGGYGARLRTAGRRLPPWPDSAPALAALRARCRVVALSNAGLGVLMDCSRAAGLQWDAVLSAEMVRSAKPDPAVYRFALDALGIDPEQVVMVAAHPWDLRAASAHGMRTAYVHRPAEADPDDEDAFDWYGTDLLGLSAHIGR